MQPSLALRTQALGRCWGGARRSMLHHVPQTAATPRTLHTQDSEEDAKEGSLDAFVMKFQQILVAPKDWRAKHPSKKTSRMKGSRGAKDAKNPSPQSQISYQPFTFKSHSVPHSSEVCLKDELASLGKGEIVNEGMDDRLRMDGMKRRGLQRGMNDRERGKDRMEGKAGEREGMNNRKRLTERGKEGLGEKSGEREGMNGAKKQQERKEEMRTGERINKTKTEHKRKEKINQETDTEEEKGEEIKEEKEREQRTETIKTRKKMNKNKKLNQEKHSEEEEEKEEEEEEAVEGRGMKALGEERALLCRVLEGVPECQDREYLQQCLRQNVVPGFGVLRRLCAGASRTPAVGTVLAIRGLAHHLHPHLYLSHLSLDYYWASALCHAGDVEQSLAILLHLHRHTHPYRHAHPHRSKKVCDITQLVLYRIVEEEEEEQVAKAVDFVDSIVTELGSLVPALSLWSATFTSPLFRVQQVSEWLVERHPGLVKLLGRRVEGLVERAAWEGDQSLLQRILHLALLHNLSLHYPSATSALLQLQCDEGDLRGAEETIKFAQKMEVRLTPVALHRFLALLSRHRRPAPLALLALKYRPPPARPPIPPPPMPKYRF